MPDNISGSRQVAHILGSILMVIGFLLFASVFVTGAMNFGDFSNFAGEVKSSMIRAILGMGLLIAGGILRTIGTFGVAGSGVVLDPSQARQDLRPHSRMAGGVLRDVLDEAKIGQGGRQPEKIIMIKCRDCGKLNEEDSKFCQECGQEM